MKTWSSCLALLAAVCIAVGATASAISMNAMTVEMAAAGPAHGTDSPCDDCGGGIDTAACATLCAAQAPAVLPSVPALRLAREATEVVAPYRDAHGRAVLPDPGPPRTGDIG